MSVLEGCVGSEGAVRVEGDDLLLVSVVPDPTTFPFSLVCSFSLLPSILRQSEQEELTPTFLRVTAADE